MKELFVIIALMNAEGVTKESVTEQVIKSQVPQTIITEQVHIDTTWIGRTETQCWTAKQHHSDGSVTAKVQCE